MIKLNKMKEPDILANNKARWTSDLMSYINNGQKIPDTVKNKYNQHEIKEVLKKETKDKCMYCESFISVVAPEHIEHYRPKAVYPQLTFDWSNLGLACPWCNTKKNNNFDESCSPINPYIDNPLDHFISLGTMICHKPGSDRGQLTELQLELNRPELMESRKNRIDAIRPLIDQYTKETNLSLKNILKKNIEKEMEDDKPYAMCIRTTVKSMINI
jgi:uncharacterized protein (TIGR02646 family)